MAKTIKYTSTDRNFNELPFTGKQSIWKPGQQEERSDVEASQLFATGKFSLPASSGVEGAKSSPCTASRNLLGSDVETRIDATSASPIVLTIQTDAIMGTSGAETVAIYQGGTGAASFAAGAGVTLRNTAPTPAQYKTHGVMRVGANEWAYIV